MTDKTQLGTIAYIEDEEALLVRVKHGWKYILVSNNSNLKHFSINQSLLLIFAVEYNNFS